MSALEDFEKAGSWASYHYADEYTEEWKKGDEEKAKALKIFDDNPELEVEMRQIAINFLWSIDRERPVEEPVV
jgi:hypothetical protein